MKAKKEGITPQQVIDKYDGIIRKSFVDFGISFDNYSRTSSKIHHDTASEFFRKLYDNGDFIEEVTEQLYDAKADQFLADRFVVGTCPKCGNEEAYGDQCEKCGSTLNATDLINPKSTITGETPILKETKHWFLPLDRYQDFLKDWILVGHAKDWKTNVLGQVKSWLDDGLKPRAVTRDLDWGIDVPVEGAEGKNCMYGLMRQLGTSHLPKNGRLVKEKIGNRIGKMSIRNWFILLEKTISCFIASFSQRC